MQLSGQVYLQYLEARSQIAIQINSLLTQQYEMAKSEESKEDPNFQVIDWARVPDEPFKPERRKIVTISFIMSFGMAAFGAFFWEYLERMGMKRLGRK